MEENKNILTAEDVQALQPLYAAVIASLKEVYDPEIPVNIYDLGLIYELSIDKEAVIASLKEVYDPEIPVNIYDLGLIYELSIDKERQVSILMTFTAPNCPMADQVMAEVRQSVEAVPGVTGCKIDLTFEPEWDRSMLSEEARVELGLDYEEDDYGKLEE